MWDLIVSVPDHCLSFYFTTLIWPPNWNFLKIRTTFCKIPELRTAFFKSLHTGLNSLFFFNNNNNDN